MNKYLSLLRKQMLPTITVFATLIYWTIRFIFSDKLIFWDLIPIAILLLYFGYVFYDMNKFIKTVINTADIPYCIITRKDTHFLEIVKKDLLLDFKKSGLSIEETLAYFKIKDTEWICHKEGDTNIDDHTWKTLIKEIGTHFILLSKKIDAKPQFHFHFIIPPEVALGVGATVGRGISCKAYQFFGETRKVIYDTQPLKDTDTYHKLSERVFDFKEIDIKSNYKDTANDTAIILDFVSHPIISINNVFKSEFSQIKITHKIHRGHLPIDYNWTILAREICSFIFQEDEKQKRLHLFFGLPSSLAFVVGTILGNYAPITVYNFDKAGQKYNEVFKLNELH